MRNLLQLVIRLQKFFVFLIFVIFCLFLILKNNSFQRIRFNNFTDFAGSEIRGMMFDKYNNLEDYLNLKTVNEQLVAENVKLRNELKYFKNIFADDSTLHIDSGLISNHIYHSAKLIKNSVYHPFNFLMIDKGLKHGIKQDMGVLVDNRVVGVVRNSSQHFSTVIPVINKNSKLSATLRGTSIPGIINWNGDDYRYATLEKIPAHVYIQKGDTVFTNTYSHVFSENFIIGFIDKYSLTASGSFYNIRVKLAVDFLHLHNLTIIENLFADEQIELENKTSHE